MTTFVLVILPISLLETNDWNDRTPNSLLNPPKHQEQAAQAAWLRDPNVKMLRNSGEAALTESMLLVETWNPTYIL